MLALMRIGQFATLNYKWQILNLLCAWISVDIYYYRHKGQIDQANAIYNLLWYIPEQGYI